VSVTIPDAKEGKTLRTKKHWLWDYLEGWGISYEHCLWIMIAFGLGFVASAVFVFTMQDTVCQELSIYLQDFFHNIAESGTDSAVLCKTGIGMNFRNVLFLLLCSFLIIGAFFIVGFSVLGGFVHGFTFFFFCKQYGIKSLLFFLLGMLPHYTLLAPAYLFFLVLVLRFSLLLREKHELKRRVVSLFAKTAVLFALMLMATLLQAYVEPALIGLIAGMF